MYHIRRSGDKEERSLHMENEQGLKNATFEARTRAYHTGVDHEVVDDEGTIITIASLAKPEPATKVPAVGMSWTTYFLLAITAATVLNVLINR